MMKKSDLRVGIDTLAVHIPKLYIDLTAEWAETRAPQFNEVSSANLVSKIRKGIGVVEMTIPDAHEDSATLAANAAVRAITQAGIDPQDIGYIAIGTETTVDQSKSIAAYVLGMIEKYFHTTLRDVGAPQFQFACIGATYALEAAVNLFRAGEETKPYALVIATDISRYPLQTSAEYTQGAGAVAMLVCKNPRLLELDPKVTSTITRDERDFFRPNGMSTAVVDGKYSIDVYLDCIEEAAERYLERARLALHQPTAALADILDHFVFHVPFPRMSEYAAARVLGQSWLQDPALKADLAAQAPLGFTPMPSSAEKRAFEKQLTATPLFKTFFAKWVEASLTIPRRVGNIYSGSMYLSLASLLESREDRAKLAGQRVGFFSYGSGASARVFSGVFKNPEQGYHPHLNEQLLNRNDGGKRISLSLANYERLHRGPEGEGLKSLLQPAPSVRPPQREFAIVRIGNETHAAKNDLGYRYYDWVN